MATLVEHKTDIEILFEYVTQVKEEIITIAKEKGMNASGKTLGSLEVVERPTGMDLYANDSIYFMEHGRGPTSPTGPYLAGPKLIDIITDWIAAKGLDISPYAVTQKIHKEGTKLFRAGGNSGVLSVPLNLDSLQEVFNELTLFWVAKASSEIYEPINNLK